MASPGQESESLNVQFLVDSMLAMVHTAGPDGRHFNQPWLEYLGVTLDDVSGWKCRAFAHREDVEGAVARWQACVKTGENFEFEAGVRGADGEYCWMLYRKVSLRDRRGNTSTPKV